MGRDRYGDYLEHIEEHAHLILDFLDGNSFAASDLKTQFAVLKAFENIGEASTRLPAELKQKTTAVNWAGVKSFRNFVVHNYDEVDDEAVDRAITTELPKLHTAVAELRRILPTFTPSDPLP
jgi:uncharacterized protein with HEPN domain